MSTFKNALKRILYYIQHVDGVWSLPLSIFIFWLAQNTLIAIFGLGTGTYDVGLFQAFFLASAIVVGAANVAVLGLYFTFRGLYRYLYGYKAKNKENKTIWINPSKKDWQALPTSTRFAIAFLVFFLFFASVILLFANLV